MRRRQLLIALAAGSLFGPLARSQERVIRIVAKKFEFIPAEIRLARGVPVILELSTEDVAMGFSAPDFKANVEIVPGKTTQLRLVPDKAGSFDFICDVFCGDGHEDMGGKIHVT
jgi:cytochrome c oxidase subunit 2